MPPAWHKAPPVVVPAYRAGCTGKVRHTTELEARRVCAVMPRHRVYACQHCRGWHLTTEKRRG